MTSVDPPKAWVTIETVVSEKPGSADDQSRSDEEKSRNDAEKSRSDEEKSRSDEEKDCMRGDENPANDKEEKGSTAKSSISEHGIYSSEQFMTVNIEVSQDGEQLHNKTHLVLVVDNSGSMAGIPWKQVKESLHAIIDSSIDMAHFKTDLIVYNATATHVHFTKSNYKKTIDDLKAGGMTNFVAAFEKVTEIVSKTGADYKQTVVVLLTDGQDTCSNQVKLSGLIPNLEKGLKRCSKQTIVHAVGFSKEHDFRFLKKVAEKGGTSPGMFRYCEPGDEKQALQAKLDELFDFILESDTQKVTVEMVGDTNFIIGPDKRSKSASIVAKVAKDEETLEKIKGTQLVANAWIYNNNPNQLPAFSLFVESSTRVDGSTRRVSIPCEIVNMTQKLVDKVPEKTRWRLRILERNVDNLLNKTADDVAKKEDVSKLQARVEKIQDSLSKTKVFGNGINKADRQEMFELIRDVQTNLDQVQKMLAEYMRSGTDSISLLARAHDMRYQAVFNKGRRQRIMDKRASKNMQHAANAQKHLNQLVVNQEEIRNISQDANDFYFCVMSQNSVQDILLGDEVEDAIGFGLAVMRSELVLDEPTLIRLQVISGTLVSRNAMLDALEYKINVSSHLKAHGGFEFDESSLGVTTVGSSREPINAWLPLYVTASHWNRIKVILKPALGSFCTLDPLGYHFKQLDVMFMVLGSMIGQLSDQSVGEHQLKLLFAVLRTCVACLEDFDKVSDVTAVVKEFVASPAGRTKDIIPNLHTLIGYIVALPVEKQKEVFPDKESLKQFWLAFLSEWLRRAASPLYKDTPLNEINGIINSLVNVVSMSETEKTKLQQKPVCNFAKELERLCLQETSGNVDIPLFDPASGLQDLESKIELKHSEKIDKAMEIWAEQKTGLQKNLDQTKKYKSALSVVHSWVNDSNVISTISEHLAGNVCDGEVETTYSSGDNDRDEVQEELECRTSKSEEQTTSSEESYDVENMTEYTLQVIAKIHNKLTKSAYPGITSVPSLMAFVNTWFNCGHDMTEIDANSGIAPDSWIEEIKCAVMDSYVKLKTNTLVERKVSSTQSDVTVVVIDGEPTNTEQLEKDVPFSEEQTEYYDEDDDDDMNYDEDDDEDGYMEMSAQREKNKNKNKKERRICLTQIIRLVDNEVNVVQLIRAMLCQAVRFHSNSSARVAIADKKMLDVKEGNEVVVEIIKLNYKYLDEFKKSARQNAVDRALWKRANYCMLMATSPWAFVGYLMNTHKSRLEGFSELVELFIKSVSPDTDLPFVKEKVHILLTGKYETYPVLDNGNQWLPEKKMARNFKNLLGEEVWTEFEMDLRANVQIHIYRESDIPNRHGHCNSNPHIPNALRKKLGMPILPEKKNAYKAARRGKRR